MPVTAVVTAVTDSLVAAGSVTLEIVHLHSPLTRDDSVNTQLPHPSSLVFAPGISLNAQRKLCGSETGCEPAKPPFVPFE